MLCNKNGKIFYLQPWGFLSSKTVRKERALHLGAQCRKNVLQTKCLFLKYKTGLDYYEKRTLKFSYTEIFPKQRHSLKEIITKVS